MCSQHSKNTFEFHIFICQVASAWREQNNHLVLSHCHPPTTKSANSLLYFFKAEVQIR